MKKWNLVNLVAGVMLAFLVMFNIGVVVCNHIYENGKQAGVNEWSQYIEQQEELKAINELKQMDVVNSEQFR